MSKKYKTKIFYNKQVVPSQVDALLAARRQKFQVLNPNTVRSHVFSRMVQQAHDASLNAGCLASKVTHNDLSHPNVHSNRGVDDGNMCYDTEVAKNSPQNPATDKAPGFESEGPGFEPLLAGYESSECEIKHSVSGCVYGDVVIAEPSGHGFESSQVTDLVVPMNQVRQESGKQDSDSAGKSDLTFQKIGPGFESRVDKDMTTNYHSSVNAVTDGLNQP